MEQAREAFVHGTKKSVRRVSLHLKISKTAVSKVLCTRICLSEVGT